MGQHMPDIADQREKLARLRRELLCCRLAIEAHAGRARERSANLAIAVEHINHAIAEIDTRIASMIASPK